ncbi:MAG: response regulator [Methylococcales bacterium]|nr:response regulator [Methylococcales bacterium]MCK5925453.1 response regulator [Methylococcales bacterium]
MAEKIKVLVVDDASFMVKAISEILNSDPDIEVVGSAKNGKLALEQIKLLHPDVITLDVDMPVMDGIKAVRHIMLECPVPIVMLSSLFSNGAISFEALRLGVVDFLPKPSGAISRDIHQSKQQILERIKLAYSVNIKNVHRVRIQPLKAEEKLNHSDEYQHLDHLLLVGTTLGGPNTSIRLFSQLSPKLATAAIVIQEVSPKILPAFAEEFNKYSAWHIREVTDGALLEAGVCYIGSNDYTLTIKTNENNQFYIALSDTKEKPLNNLFSSAAKIFNGQTIGVLLTGLGDDGSEGFSSIKKYSGVTLAQRSETCVYPNLVECAKEKGVVDKVIDQSDLVTEIEMLIKDHESDLLLS